LLSSPHIVLFQFELKYKPGLKYNLHIDADPEPHLSIRNPFL
jgi:hypothetical protein